MTNLAKVKDFWETHVNNEYYTSAQRGSRDYFAEIEERRYRHHYHLLDLFEQLRSEGVTGKKLLEIGCGMGNDTFALARLGFREVVGVDLTRAAIQIAEERATAEHLDCVRFEVADCERLSFPNGYFDVVYSFGVIHHTPSIENAISEIERVLKPGGRAVVMIYHRHSIVDAVHRLLRLPYESPQNIKDHCPIVNRYTRGEAAALFAAFGSVRIHTDYPFTYGMRHMTFFWPKFAKRALGRVVGWHLMIDARKQA